MRAQRKVGSRDSSSVGQTWGSQLALICRQQHPPSVLNGAWHGIEWSGAIQL